MSIIGITPSFPNADPSPRKEQRRMVQQEFDREGSARFDPLLARASHVLLAGLIDRPEDWHNRMRL